MEKLGLKIEYEFEGEVRYVIGRSKRSQKVIADEPSPSKVNAAQ